MLDLLELLDNSSNSNKSNDYYALLNFSFMENIRTGIVIQARLGSSRLPGKVLRPNFYHGNSILDFLLSNLLRYFRRDEIIIATTIQKQDDLINNFAKAKGVQCFRGNEHDVLSRFINAAVFYEFTHVVRVCSDNPLILPEFITVLLSKENFNFDYTSFANPNKVPAIRTHFGLFTELVSVNCLKKLHSLPISLADREHVTKYIYDNKDKFSINLIEMPPELNHLQYIRCTVDDKVDFDNAKYIVNQLEKEFSLSDIIKVINKNETLKNSMINQIKKYTK